MFIRQTKTNASASGKSYLTYRLVESKRVGKKVSQRTVLNLGRNFDIPRELWPDLCSRIDQILDGENPLFPPDKSVEQKAQHIYAQILALSLILLASFSAAASEWWEVDLEDQRSWLVTVWSSDSCTAISSRTRYARESPA